MSNAKLKQIIFLAGNELGIKIKVSKEMLRVAKYNYSKGG